MVAAGNRVALLRDGAETYPAMLEAIDGAKQFVHLETYIFADDFTGRRFAEALAAAAKRGVEVALLFDSLGSWKSGSWLFEWMAGHGVKVLGYKPLVPWRTGWGWPRRDHRKMLVVDGAQGFTGGINVGDQWAAEKDGGKAWRDTMVRLVGPAVHALDQLFRETWAKESKRQKRAVTLSPPPGDTPPPPPPLEGEIDGAAIQIVGNREFGRRRAIRRAYRHAMAQARRSIFIANAYFIPDHAILRSLRAARRRGVRVAILVPGESDVASVTWASRAVYEKLLSWGIEIFQWCKPVFHAKTAVIDGVWSTVGSYNLDTQSLRYNLEVTALAYDREVAERLEAMFCDDSSLCERLDLESWRRRPWWWRVPERVCYAFRAWL